MRATAEVEDYMDSLPLREGIDDLLKPAPREILADTTDEERERAWGTAQAPQRFGLVGHRTACRNLAQRFGETNR